MKPASFFDDEGIKNVKKIWAKPAKGQESIEKLKPSILLKATWMKKTKKNGKTKARVFFISETALFMAKNEKTDKVSGVLDLICVKLDVIPNVEPKTVDSSCADTVHGFRLCRNGKILEFYSRDAMLFSQWRSLLTLKAIQSTFHDEFIVTKMIGKGSFAKVYLATKKENGKQYAIKAFNKEFMQSQHKGKESLVNEINMMRNLNNENLINLYEVYETTNSIYFVVDLLSGGELLHRIREKGSLEEDELRFLIRNLLKALHHLHSRNIMHRDLKPENLLLKSKENSYDIVVADFGLATFTNIKDILFKRCGTPGFVAPEVLLFKEGEGFYDVKCDIFSAGVIFYLLLTGKQPFQGKDYKQILRANKECEISYESSLFDNVSVEAKDLLKRMLDPKPNSRLSAQECLSHPFVNAASQKQNTKIQNIENLNTYEVEYLANVRNKNQEADDQKGSMAFYSAGTPALNGRTDTAGSLSTYSNSTIPARQEKLPPLSSKFSKPRSDSIDANGLNAAILGGGGQSHNSSREGSPLSQSTSTKKSEMKNLHMLAIKNNMNKDYQTGSEDKKGQQEYYEDSEDVSEENSPISKSVYKMNFEKQMKHSPSKSYDDDSPTSSNYKASF